MSPTRFADILWTVVLALACAAAVGAVVFLGFSCTPAQRADVGGYTVTGAKIAACVQGVLADEEQRRLRDAREAEIAAQLEAERIEDAAREHPPSVKQEIEKVLKEGAK